MKEADPALPSGRHRRRLLVIGVNWPLETFLENLLRGLADAGWSVTVASRQHFGAASLPLRRLPLPKEGAFGLLPHLPRMAAALLRQPSRAMRAVRGRPAKLRQLQLVLPLLAGDFDLFYFPWNGAALDYLPLFGIGVPTLLSCRGSHVQVSPHNPKRPELRQALPELFAAATAVHCVSQDMVDEAARLGLDPAKATVIRPAVDPGFFEPPEKAPSTDGPLRLVGAGSLIWRKGFEYALRALAELKRRGRSVHLTLVGEGQDRQRLLFAIDDLGLQNEVVLAGRRKPAELRDLLQAADVFLLPSVSEGISNAALEAMACGLPVVASDCGGMKEAIEDGRNGFLVRPRDPVAIADAVERLAVDTDLREALGRAARQRVERDFSLSDQVAAFDELLCGLVEKKGTGDWAPAFAGVTVGASSRNGRFEDERKVRFESEPKAGDWTPALPGAMCGVTVGASSQNGRSEDERKARFGSEPKNGQARSLNGHPGEGRGPVPSPLARNETPGEKARVVLVVPVFPKLSETFVARHFLGLLDRGWDVFVLCDRSPAEAWRFFPLLDRPEIRRRIRLFAPTRPRLRVLATGPLLLLGCLLRRPRFIFRNLRHGLRQLYLDAAPALLRPDLVHFEFGTLAVGRAGLGERLDCPVAVSFRGYDLNFAGLGEAGFYEPVWKEAAAIHVLGEDLRRRAWRRGCPPELPCRSIPPAVDASRFPERSGERRPGPLRILSVGRLEWKKGYEDALVALALLRDQGIDFRWRLIGDGDHLEAIAFARHQLGLEDQVELALSLPPAAVAAELAAADLFLHPAISEGFCNAVLEAQAAGLPVVCTDADGLAENVDPGVTGLVAARRDPEALAAAIEELASDPERRRRMGEAGRERALQVFLPAAEIDGFEAFYRDILASWKAKCGSIS